MYSVLSVKDLFSMIKPSTVKKVLADFVVLYVTDESRHYCKALCDVKFCQIKGNGRKFSHIELSNAVIS